MKNLIALISLVGFLMITGCATAPMTYEESLSTNRATRNDVPDWDKNMRYRVGFLYANAARHQIDKPSLSRAADPSLDFQVPFAVLDYVRGDNLSGGLALVDWFNSGLSDDNFYRYYYNRGLAFMVHPNTHYFSFDEREGDATSADVHTAWNEAHELFEAIHNRSGRCYIHGYSDELQYRRTFSKDVPGRYKEVSYWCPHPVLSDREHRVSVSAWANPYDGIRVLSTVQSQCFRTIRGEDFVDVRECGLLLADRQRSLIPDSRFGWMELVVTPAANDPVAYEVIARAGNSTTRLQAPQRTEQYIEFLASRPYGSN